jgi:regulatory protein
MNGDNNSTRKNIKTPNKPKQPKKLSERYLRNAGEYYLNRFPASSNHFVTVMTRKIDKSCHVHTEQDRQHWIDHVRDVVVPYFTDLGFLNDELYSRALFNSLKNKGLSSYVIRNRMKIKGIEARMIDTLTKDTENGLNDKKAVHIFARKKKLGKYKITASADDNDKRKDLGKLARAGFSYELAMSVFE